MSRSGCRRGGSRSGGCRLPERRRRESSGPLSLGPGPLSLGPAERPEALTITRAKNDNLVVANERYSSWLIDEGVTRQITYDSLGRSLLTAALGFAAGCRVLARQSPLYRLSVAPECPSTHCRRTFRGRAQERH